MTEWTNIPDETLEPGRPIRSVDGLALRDNPVAIAEGASGAPRIVNAAIQDGTLSANKFRTTNTERNWVLGRTAAAALNALGTYRMAFYRSSTRISPGATVSGSVLRVRPDTDSSGFLTFTERDATADSLSGTWRLMGHHGIEGDLSVSGASIPAALFLRIS